MNGVVNLFGSGPAHIMVSYLSKVESKLIDCGFNIESRSESKYPSTVSRDGVIYDITYKTTSGGDLYGIDLIPL